MTRLLRSPPSAGDAAAIFARRRERRTVLIQQRMAVPSDAYRALCQAVLLHVVSAFPDLWTGTVGLYWPYKREVSLFPLGRRIQEAGGRVALPVVVGKDQPFQFRAWTPGDPLAIGPLGIAYPRDGHKVQPDSVLVALVGFDRENHRLGYGGGYYDRTLATAPRPFSIGIGFELMRLQTIEPLSHDIPMDVIVTETGLFRRSPRPT